ncbi:MAG: hypothetical protein HC883_03935 [Bdellovibrionaceae bacterium]|nr:hypothetical protein [Pseudobdellovibrionaceae bacterium]
MAQDDGNFKRQPIPGMWGEPIALIALNESIGMGVLLEHCIRAAQDGHEIVYLIPYDSEEAGRGGCIGIEISGLAHTRWDGTEARVVPFTVKIVDE